MGRDWDVVDDEQIVDVDVEVGALAGTAAVARDGHATLLGRGLWTSSRFRAVVSTLEHDSAPTLNSATDTSSLASSNSATLSSCSVMHK